MSQVVKDRIDFLSKADFEFVRDYILEKTAELQKNSALVQDPRELFEIAHRARAFQEFGEAEKTAATAGQLKCGAIFKKIYEALDRNEAPAGDPHYREMWKFANRYIGKRVPVARLIRMRSLLEKKTELVATPEVVIGTRYQALAK